MPQRDAKSGAKQTRSTVDEIQVIGHMQLSAPNISEAGFVLDANRYEVRPRPKQIFSGLEPPKSTTLQVLHKPWNPPAGADP